MNLFFDSSAFIKRYVDEVGSNKVEKLCTDAENIGISILLPIEIIATFSRLKREKKITGQQYRQLKTELFTDIRDISIIPLAPETVNVTIDAIELSPLKTLDAVHIGCALEYRPDYFVSSDRQQLVAAAKAGLRVKRVP